MSDEAVKAKTGKVWSEWFELLDAAGARKMDHKQIVAHLRSKHHVGDWWVQMVTVAYEQARGLRKAHQKADGFSAVASKTIAAPVSNIYAAWQDARLRGRWLPKAKLEVRKATRDKSLRITWDGGSSLDVSFYPKGDAKAQVTIEHSKLRDEKEWERMKSYWGAALDRLKEMVEA